MANISMAPGVLIQEVTGPGVIAGVGTSTAAFIGPAVAGPINVPKFITSFDEFLETYAVLNENNTLDPHIKTVKKFYLAHAVEGFFLNGGKQAFIVRVGNGRAAEWEVKNRDGAGQTVFRIQAKKEGIEANNLELEIKPSNITTTPLEAVSAQSRVTKVEEVNGEVRVTVGDSSLFRVGDVVDKEGATVTATIERIDGAILILTNAILPTLAPPDNLKIANLTTVQNTLRLQSTAGLFPGSVVLLEGDVVGTAGADEDHALIQSVDRAGFVRFASKPPRAKDFEVSGLKLTSQEFGIKVSRQGAKLEEFENLSLQPLHPNHVQIVVQSDLIQILPPKDPPTTNKFPEALVKDGALGAPNPSGRNDNPMELTRAEFEKGLEALENIDDVNLLVVPDASSHADWEAIQNAMIAQCIALKDRFAILDSRPNATRDEVLAQRSTVNSENGRAALYYPWLEVRDPDSPQVPLPLFIPPSGHLAGIYARTDQERGVHKAPANTDVRGVFGLQARLTDGQQIKLNDEGINVLRIFQGSASVIVWGARTTVSKEKTDWRYVPVRRLLLFIEESIEEGIRFAVFEPNALPLWQQLKRTIREFLTRVWRDGALFGDTADQAFQVRIDEALNPPSVRALGQLFIEIKVAPVRPAEFIIVRIGLFDGGADVNET